MATITGSFNLSSQSAGVGVSGLKGPSGNFAFQAQSSSMVFSGKRKSAGSFILQAQPASMSFEIPSQNYTAERNGDYTGIPTARIKNGILTWISSTELLVQWEPAIAEVDAAGTDHVLVYVNGVCHATRSNRRSQIITITPGAVPNVCVVYIPLVTDWDNLYDPIGSDPAANNCYLVTESLYNVITTLKRGTRSTVTKNLNSSLGVGRRSTLHAGIGVN